jgi:hypothetical protein
MGFQWDFHDRLVVEPNPSETYEFVSWGYYSPYMEKMLQTTNQMRFS